MEKYSMTPLTPEEEQAAISQATRIAVEAQTPEFRVGKSIGTTIYRVGDGQPCGWFPNNPTLAGRVVDLLNAVAPAPPADTPRFDDSRNWTEDAGRRNRIDLAGGC